MTLYITGGKVTSDGEGSITESDHSGVDIHFVKKTKMLYIGGWYDSCCGIESVSIPLSDFLKKLGVSKQMLSRIQKEWDNES